MKQTSLYLPDDIAGQADGLIPFVRAVVQEKGIDVGTVNRSDVLRMALRRGLEDLEKEKEETA
jgi:hypothetical protein